MAIRVPDWVPDGHRHPDRRGLRIGVGQVGLQRGHHHLGAQRGRRHRDLDHHLEVVALAAEDLVAGHAQLDVQVAGRSAAGADLTVGGQVDPVAGADARRDLDVDRPGRPHPAVAGALGARVGDHRAVAAAGRAGLGGPDVTDERPLHVGHVTLAVAGRAAHRLASPRPRPAPLHRGQSTAVSTRSGLVVPNAASASSRSSRTRASWPRRTRDRGPRGALLAEHRVDQVGEVEATGPEAAVEAAHPGPPSGSPPRSYRSRFLGSCSTSYASATFLKRSAASGSWPRRGAASSPAGGRPS